MTTIPDSPAALPPVKYLLCATMDPSARPFMPRRRYWNASTRTWGDWADATRYDETITTQGVPRTPLPHPDAKVAWTRDLPTDLDGFPYNPNSDNIWRLTKCCAAGSSIDDGPLYCKCCYETQPLEVDTPPRLDGNWEPGDGPILITLPPQG